MRVHACVRACVRVVFTCITTVMLANVVCIWPFPEPASVICNEGRTGTASNPYTSECLCARFAFICIIYLFILLFLCLPNVFRSTSGRLERHLVARTYRTTPPRACTQRAKTISCMESSPTTSATTPATSVSTAAGWSRHLKIQQVGNIECWSLYRLMGTA